MTEPTNGAAAPKKRTFGFKKAAWQTAPKKDEQDMFSHSNEFQDIVAEQAKRQEDKKKAEEALKQKQKAEEERNGKKRKVTVEAVAEVRPRSSPRNQRVASKGCVSLPSVWLSAQLTGEQAKQDSHVSDPRQFGLGHPCGALRLPHQVRQQLRGSQDQISSHRSEQFRG